MSVASAPAAADDDAAPNGEPPPSEAGDSPRSKAAPKESETAPIPVGPDRKVRVYRLESITVEGTDRITADQAAESLGLKRGVALDDDLVMSARRRLLSLGLFKSAILMMRKGSKPGWARLIIDVEEDDTVLTSWGIGGELSATVTEDYASSVSNNTAPMDYRLGLVARNLLRRQHRGSVAAEVDSKGILRRGHVAYGLPRFTREDVQFDAEVEAVDFTERYASALGFGGRGQGLWSQSLTRYGQVQYGAAMYVNRPPRFGLAEFPEAVAGPKVGYRKETRLRGFFPEGGHLIDASLLFAPTRVHHSVLELNFAKTFDFAQMMYTTFDVKALSVGVEGYSVRGESRLDFPFGGGRFGEDQGEVFVRFRGGQDIYGDLNLVGSAAILGVRYHSLGFIAELAVKITRSPEDLTPKTLDPSGAGARQ